MFFFGFCWAFWVQTLLSLSNLVIMILFNVFGFVGFLFLEKVVTDMLLGLDQHSLTPEIHGETTSKWGYRSLRNKHQQLGP